MDDVYENIGDYNPSGKRKSLTMFDDTIAEIISNKKELFWDLYDKKLTRLEMAGMAQK